jgi:hypothetical protein
VRTSAPAGASKEPAPSADIAACKAAAAPCRTHGCELQRSQSPHTSHAQGRARNTHVPAAPPHLGARGRRRGPRDRAGRGPCRGPCHDCTPPVSTVAQTGSQRVSGSRRHLSDSLCWPSAALALFNLPHVIPQALLCGSSPVLLYRTHHFTDPSAPALAALALRLDFFPWMLPISHPQETCTPPSAFSCTQGTPPRARLVPACTARLWGATAKHDSPCACSVLSTITGNKERM